MDFSFNAPIMVIEHYKNLLIAFLLCAKYLSFSLNMLLFLCLRPNSCGPLAFVFFLLKVLSNKRILERVYSSKRVKSFVSCISVVKMHE